MFLSFCYKGFHWPTIIVIIREGKEDKMRWGVVAKKIKGGYAGEGGEDKMQGGWLRKKFEGVVTKEN